MENKVPLKQFPGASTMFSFYYTGVFLFGLLPDQGLSDEYSGSPS